jgi:hypothetical protein
VAGANEPDRLFTPDTYPLIYKYSGGLPRLINTLCDTAMTVAFADNVHSISLNVLNTAIEELQWLPYAKRINKRRAGMLALGRSEMDGLLHENTKALTSLGGQLNRLDGVAPALSSLSARMTNIESLLKRIADSLDARQKDADNVRKIYPRQEK